MIISNQIKCHECQEEIYSAHRHDYVTCKCGGCSVDGGTSYLRRVGEDWIEMSIEYPDDLLGPLIASQVWCGDTGRNDLGRVCAFGRAIRDAGYRIVKEN